MKKKYLFGALLAMAAGNLSAITNVPAIISTSQVWDISGSPYVIAQNVLIQPGAKVEVRPGVTVQGSGSLSIAVSGEFCALGTKDSMITLSHITINYLKDAVDYNPSTGMGSRIYYTNFTTSLSSHTYGVQMASMHLRADHCNFEKQSYCIYHVGTDSASLHVTNTTFDGSHQFGAVYPIYGFNAKTRLTVDYCNFLKTAYCYAAENSDIQHSYFDIYQYGTGWYVGYMVKKLNFGCNYMRRANVGLELGSSMSPTAHVNIHDNYFDSCGSAIRLYCFNKNDSIYINNNNFGQFSKFNIEFSSCNSTSGTYKWLDARDNYWFTTDTAAIHSSIQDFRKDIKVNFQLDISGYRSNPVNGCWPNVPAAVSHAQKQTLQLFPNPASSLLHMHAKVDGRYHVLNMNGQEILQGQIVFGDNAIDISRLNSGIYIFQFGTASAKFIKE